MNKETHTWNGHKVTEAPTENGRKWRCESCGLAFVAEKVSAVEETRAAAVAPTIFGEYDCQQSTSKNETVPQRFIPDQVKRI